MYEFTNLTAFFDDIHEIDQCAYHTDRNTDSATFTNGAHQVVWTQPRGSRKAVRSVYQNGWLVCRQQYEVK